MTDPNNRKPPSPLQTSVAKGLSLLSHATSPFIATFLLVHLTAPVLAYVGGTDLASQTMLLGREYYQTEFGETYLVLGPIAIHALAGISKRLILSLPSSTSTRKQTPETPTSHQRPLKSLLGLTAYTTALALLPIHFLVHRYYPTLPIESISSVGPSSLDYEYVKYGLHTWPRRSWILYAGLVSSVAFHASDGIVLIWNTWFSTTSRSRSRKLSRRTWRGIAIAGVIAPVLLGVYAMAKEPPRILSSFLGTRYKAAYVQSSIFQI